MKHTPKKRFGQNFLKDEYVIQQIIKIINPKDNQNLIEIGPGLGAITDKLLENVQHINVVEIDRDIIKFLQQKYDDDKLTIHESDALKFDFYKMGNNLRVIGNLPYNISTPLLFHLNKFENIIDMHFMLQKEVVDRICANPGSGDYGRLTVMLQYKYKCTSLLSVPPNCFYPAPKVESAIIRMIPKEASDWQHIDEKRLNNIVTTAFSQRRKTISNSLSKIFSKEQLQSLEININDRAENLTIEDYIKLSKIK